MSADLRLVMHPAQRNPAELPSQRLRDRPTKRGLSHARRPDEAQDRSLHVRLQPAHAQVVQNTVLHLLQAVVILIQDLFRLQNVDLAGSSLRPWQHCQPLHVIPRQAVVRRHRIHPVQPAKLLQGVFFHVLRHARVFNLLPQLGDVFLRIVLVAQFLLDRLHLLTQVVVALRLLYRVLHLALDLVPQSLNVQFLRQVLVQSLQAAGNTRRLKQLLLLGGGQKRQVRRNKVRQPPRFFNIDRDCLEVVRQRRRRRHNLLKLARDVPLQCLQLR